MGRPAGLWGPEDVDAEALSPLSRFSSLQDLRLEVSFTLPNEGGWAFLRAMPQLSSLHLAGQLGTLCARRSAVPAYLAAQHLPVS